MGRELKRVPLDFDHPSGRVWPGFVNPHYKKCATCDGSGDTTARQRLSDLVSLLLLSGEDSLKGSNHPYFRSMRSVLPHDVIPSADMAELTGGLSRPITNGRAFGHDAIDRWTATTKIIEAAGLDPQTWGLCPDCKGHGVAADVYEAYDAWKPTEPPTGEGYQVWENVSEGSPISPVFAAEQDLINWLTDQGYSEGAAEEFARGGYAPSFAMVNGRLYENIETLNAATGNES
jgi:hypothetical protein